MNQIPLWILTALSIAGTILNIKKRKECFVIWLVTNLAWCAYDFFVIHNYPQGFLFLVYALLALWGLIEWRLPGSKNP